MDLFYNFSADLLKFVTPPAHLMQSLVQRRSCSRQFAALRTPPPGRCLATRPAAGRRAGSVNSPVRTVVVIIEATAKEVKEQKVYIQGCLVQFGKGIELEAVGLPNGGL